MAYPMKNDFLILAAKLLLVALIVCVCLLYGWRYVLYGALSIAALLVVLWLLLLLWRGYLRVRHDMAYAEPRGRFQEAVQQGNAAAFEKLLLTYMPLWRRNQHLSLCEDAFFEVVQADAMPLMRIMLQQADAAWWQSCHVADALCRVILHGSPQMLRFLIEQGMRTDAEWESPWLIALINARLEHARVLANLGCANISAEQQARSAWPPLPQILNDASFWASPAQHRAVAEFLETTVKVSD